MFEIVYFIPYNGTMSNVKKSKINRLLSSQPRGVVLLSSWLVSQGYSSDLQKRYRKSGWLESIGTGAMIRTGDEVGYEGALYALQQQLGMSIHLGGRSAMSMLGKAHYLELSPKKVVLFGGHSEKLPVWFKNYDWDLKVKYYQSNFLPSELGLTEVELKTFTIKISGAIRALMECLHLSPKNQELSECYELMENLTTVRPDHVQALLEACNSVKVKRLFIYMAEKAQHTWVPYLDLNKVDFGSGKRSIVKNGAYVSKYQITVPRHMEQDDQPSI